MKCNACWRESEGLAISTTCGHLLCTLQHPALFFMLRKGVSSAPLQLLNTLLQFNWSLLTAFQVLRMRRKYWVMMAHAQYVIKCYRKGQWYALALTFISFSLIYPSSKLFTSILHIFDIPVLLYRGTSNDVMKQVIYFRVCTIYRPSAAIFSNL